MVSHVIPTTVLLDKIHHFHRVFSVLLLAGYHQLSHTLLLVLSQWLVDYCYIKLYPIYVLHS
jgi:hypothetical protein